ncbi:DNA-binding transcriptional regulator AraC [Pedobacter glucosidilyticus]|nr:DNA-binding transcriptional regulator AraC [Pedobacter glucosidilyticus]
MGFFSSVLIIVAVLSLVKVSILLLRKAGDKKANSLLSIFFFIVFFYSLQGFVIEAGYLKDLPGFYVWPLPIYALMHVVIFFYFKCILDKSITWKASYTLLFIPFLLALVDVFLFSLKPSTEKISIINDAILNPADRFEKQYGLFALKEHFLIRSATSFLTICLLWFKLPFFLKYSLNKETNNWLTAFLAILSVVIVLTFILSVEKCFPEELLISTHSYTLLMSFMFVSSFLMVILPFYFPIAFLNFSSPFSTSDDIKCNKLSKFSEGKIIEEEKEKYGLNVAWYNSSLKMVEIERLYLSPNFDITLLASHIEAPVHHLSYFFNHHYGISFSNYRNNLRMQHAVKLIEEGFLVESTIEALASECGFTSRSAFSKTFKAIIGQNPKDYFLEVQNRFLISQEGFNPI